MPRVVKVRQGEMTLWIDFLEPLFNLLRDDIDVAAKAYQALAPLGVRISDIRWEGAGGSLADKNLYCQLPTYLTEVRLKLDKLELRTLDIGHVDAKWLGTAALAALEVVRLIGSETAYRTYSFALHMHGTFEGASLTEFLGAFTQSAPDLGPLLHTGAAFYYGERDKRTHSAVTLDRSAVVNDGLYFRLAAVYDATKIEPSELVADLASFVSLAYQKLELTVEPS